jgi:polyphosphate kinase
MPRNFFRRIEAVFPVEDRRLRERVKNQVLGTCLADNVKSWQLRADATYALRRPAGGAPRRSQAEFMALAGGR